jgi:hypothetical protein
MSKIYEVNATEVVSGFFHVEAESAAEAALLIEHGYAHYEQNSNSYSDIEYHIEELTEEETGDEVYDYSDYSAFEKAYRDGREFYENQGQLKLNDGKPGWDDAHLFALNYAREETGLGLNEQAA